MILGIYPGLEHTGWALLTLGRQCVDYGVIVTSKALADPDRAEITSLRIQSLLDEHEGIAAVSVCKGMPFHDDSTSTNRSRHRAVVNAIAAAIQHTVSMVFPTTADAVSALGVPMRAKDCSLKLTIDRIVSTKSGISPSNAQSRLAYAAAWWAISVRTGLSGADLPHQPSLAELSQHGTPGRPRSNLCPRCKLAKKHRGSSYCAKCASERNRLRHEAKKAAKQLAAAQTEPQ